jgi:TBC1 domain family member 20
MIKIILSRKPEVERLEHEGEEGMIHSLLSSLPDLYEDNEESGSSLPAHNDAVDMPETVISEPSASDPSNGILSPSTSSTFDFSCDIFSPSMGSDTVLGTETDEASTVAALSDDEFEKEYHFASPPVVTSSLPLSPEPPQIYSLAEGSTSPPILTSSIASEVSSESAHHVSHPNNAPVSTEANSQVSSSPMKTDSSLLATSSPAPFHSVSGTNNTSTPDYDTDSDDANDPSSPHYRRPRFSLSSLLTKADELYAATPPSDPALGVSTILGPLSVMHTWSEDFARQPDDDEAEQIVGQPEKIVLPVVETPPANHEKGKENEVTEPTRKRKKKLGAGGHVVHNRTVFTSAVVVLGVALAIYSVKSRGLGGIGGAASSSAPWSSSEWSRWIVNGLL